MSEKIMPAPPPPPPAPEPELEEWLTELHGLTRDYKNARHDQRVADGERQRFQLNAEEAAKRAEKVVKQIAALMRQRCGPAFLAGLAAEGADDLDRRTIDQLDGIDRDTDRWELSEGDESGVDLGAAEREEPSDDE